VAVQSPVLIQRSRPGGRAVTLASTSVCRVLTKARKLAGEREVLLLVGHTEQLEAEPGVDPLDDLLDEVIGSGRAGGDTDDVDARRATPGGSRRRSRCGGRRHRVRGPPAPAPGCSRSCPIPPRGSGRIRPRAPGPPTGGWWWRSRGRSCGPSTGRGSGSRPRPSPPATRTCREWSGRAARPGPDRRVEAESRPVPVRPG
jgi:hypothetical protein